MRPVLEQPALSPQQGVQTGPVEPAEPAPQDQELVPCHNVDRIHLKDPQPAQHLPHPVEPTGRARPGQVLATDREPPRLVQAERQVA